MRTAVILVVLPVLGTLLVAAPAPAQESDGAAASRSVFDGVYTEDQAVAGKAIFGQSCSYCHTSSQFRGLVAVWRGRTVHDLFEHIRTTMPYDGPGRLQREEYVRLVAYILSLNGVPAGPDTLRGDESLKAIRIGAQSGPRADRPGG